MIRTLRGTVVSDKMDKTVVVAVASVKEHPIYRKKYQVTTRFKAHDADNSCHTGDVVEISETRQLSAQKHFTVSKIVTSAPREDLV